ncbi:MAG: hypothetical protein AB7K36_23960, partial [Chloroflexota bacterium]
MSRRRLLIGVLAGAFAVACGEATPPANPSPVAASSPAAGPAAPGQPVATSVQIVPAQPPTPAAGTPGPQALQSGLPLIVPGRQASPGVIASPGASPGPRIVASPAASPLPLPINLGRPGLLAVEQSGRILVLDPTRQQPARVLVSSPDSSEPRWSPDGSSLLYVGGESVAAELRLIPAAGGPQRRLTANTSPERAAAWSPAGDLLAYTVPTALKPDRTPDSAAPEEIWLLDVASGQDRKLVDGFEPAWSPDGRWIAYATNGQRSPEGARENAIRVISVNGQDDRPLLAISDLPPDLLEPFGLPFRPGTIRLRRPAWSPTGQYLIASADGHTSYAVMFDTHGNIVRPWALAYEGGVGRARWSPDGMRLAIESQPPTGVNVVKLADLTSGQETVIGGPEAGFQAQGPAWSPDGRRLALIAASLPARRGEPRQTTLRLFGLDGADLGDLVTEPGLRTP